MDLTNQLDGVVSTIVREIQARVSDQVSTLVRTELTRQLESLDLHGLVSDILSDKLDHKIETMKVDPSSVQKRIDAVSDTIATSITTTAKQEVEHQVFKRINDIDFGQRFAQAMSMALDARVETITFPDNSIPAESVKQGDLRITGDQVHGGMIRQFSSTGIDDRATSCVMTLLDTAVVVENNLVTLDLTVQGNLDVKGTIPEDSEFYQQLTSAVTNTVKQGLNQELFSSYSDILFDKMRTDGLDLTKITVNQEPIIDGNKIGYGITESNLQKLGELKELRVQGEALIADSFYVGHKRVGINTIEPSAALAVWDGEIELTVGKLKENTAVLGMPRNQTLVLSSNRNQNVVLNPDGSTQIDKLQIGQLKVTSGEAPPSFSSQRGHIVLNSNPTIGSPMGWICLGAANWANLPPID